MVFRPGDGDPIAWMAKTAGKARAHVPPVAGRPCVHCGKERPQRNTSYCSQECMDLAELARIRGAAARKRLGRDVAESGEYRPQSLYDPGKEWG